MLRGKGQAAWQTFTPMRTCMKELLQRLDRKVAVAGELMALDGCTEGCGEDEGRCRPCGGGEVRSSESSVMTWRRKLHVNLPQFPEGQSQPGSDTNSAGSQRSWVTSTRGLDATEGTVTSWASTVAGRTP